MKKRDFKRLALLGMTSGLLVSSQVRAENEQFSESASIDSQDGRIRGSFSFEAKCTNTKGGCANFKASCKDKGGCASIVAERDKSAAEQKPFVDPAQKDKKEPDPNDGNLNYHLMTEQELLLELNEEGVKKYNSLSKEGKALAIKVASASCDHTNECNHLNACQTDKNPCAGKGPCAAQGKCSISDKNLAVKLVYDKMNEKRSNLTK